MPGYKEVATAILEEVQGANLLYIRDSMIAAMRSFVVNPKLLNAIIKLIFRKTSIYNSVSVLKAMDLTSTMFLQIYHKDLQVPSDFDFTFFNSGLNMLIEQEHGTNTAKALWLLYQMIHALPLN